MVYSRLVEKYLCSRGGSQKPAASRRNLLHVSRGVFSNKTRFVFAHEDHLCHRTDFLFEALVAMLRACVFLRRHHTFPRQRLELAAAQSHTEQFGQCFKLCSRDAADEICSKFVPELEIWPQQVTLAN